MTYFQSPTLAAWHADLFTETTVLYFQTFYICVENLKDFSIGAYRSIYYNRVHIIHRALLSFVLS